MENLETLRLKANRLAKKKCYNKLFTCIDSLHFEYWSKIIFPDKNKDRLIIGQSKNPKDSFWLNIANSPHFKNISLKKAAKLLNVYFRNPRNACALFNSKFVLIDSTYAKLFIEKFKSSYAIYEDSFIDSVGTLLNSMNEEIRLHVQFWRYAHKVEKSLWEYFKEEEELWTDLAPQELLAITCLYMETRKEIELPYYLFNVVGSFYFSKKKIKNKKLSYEQAFVKMASIYENCRKQPQNKYFNSLDKLSSWFQFAKGNMSLYSFSDNYFLSETNGHYFLNCISPERHARWETNGRKINLLPLILENNYQADATTILNQNKNKVTIESLKKKKVPDKLLLQELAFSFLIDNLKYSHYNVDKEQVLVKNISSIFNNFIMDSKLKYAKPITEIRKKETLVSNQLPEITKLIDENKKRHYLPFKILKIEEFKKVADSIETSLESLNKIICFQPDNLNKGIRFDRFHPFIQIEAQPFFEINEQIIYFRNFLSPLHNSFKLINFNTHFHGDKAYKNKTILRPDKLVEKESVQFERYFENELFQNHGLDKIVTRKVIYKNGKPYGDIDLMLFHGGILMIVEIKRIRFKSSISELYKENEQMHKKGAKQINKIKAYLEDKMNDSDIKRNLGIDMNQVQKIIPLLISTSLEQDGELIEGVLKQNFFQFNFHARYPVALDKDYLRTFYETLKKDTFWTRCIDYGFSPYVHPKSKMELRYSFPKL